MVCVSFVSLSSCLLRQDRDSNKDEDEDENEDEDKDEDEFSCWWEKHAIRNT